MNDDEYVSPFDARTRPADPLAPRPASLVGARVALLDIGKNRGAEFLDRVEVLLRQRGARPFRAAKEVFSKPAEAGLIDQLSQQADLVVEALAD